MHIFFLTIGPLDSVGRTMKLVDLDSTFLLNEHLVPLHRSLPIRFCIWGRTYHLRNFSTCRACAGLALCSSLSLSSALPQIRCLASFFCCCRYLFIRHSARTRLVRSSLLYAFFFFTSIRLPQSANLTYQERFYFCFVYL